MNWLANDINTSVGRGLIQGWIYWGVGGRGGGRVHRLALARGGAGGPIYHDKAKNNGDKMRYSNLSNNMMINEL
jgi:hypothetical protein